MDIFYQINKNLKNNNIDYTKQLLESIDINSIKNKKSYYSLLLRYYIKIDDIKLIEYIVFNNILMKRDYLLYCTYNNDIIKNKLVIDIILKKDEIVEKDINYIISNCPHILYLLDGYYCLINKSNFNNYKIFKKYNIDHLKETLINFYKTKININDIKKSLEKYDIILDAGNIIYTSTNGKKPNYNNLLKILKLLKNKNPLIIIHEKHMKINNSIINILKQKYLNNILITPYQKYDDYYIIYTIIKTGIPVISNDKYRDHIYDMFKILYKENVKNYNNISNFIKDNIITYSLNKINFENHHFKYSRCIQCIDGITYIPTINSFYKII